MNQKDVIIIGGGFVGLTAALLIAKLGLDVCVLDSKPAQRALDEDGRAIALAYTSTLLFKNLRVWPHIAAHLNPIMEVITSEQGHFNKLRIRASDLEIPYLGQVCSAPQLGEGLLKACRESTNIELINDAMVTIIDPPARTIQYMQDDAVFDLKAKLILSCDGAGSALAKSLGYHVSTKTYDQSAWVSNVTVSLPHHNTAIERFTALGTLAMLPLKNDRMTVVLSLPSDKKADWTSLDDKVKLATLKELLGERLGVLSELGKTFEYPLYEQALDVTHEAGLLFLGNAVHTINPIAAQGLNLALRDLSILYDVLSDAMALSQDLGSTEVLAKYDAKVRPSHESMIRLTDFLVFISKHKLKYARSVGLGLLNTTLGKGLLAKTLAGLSSHRGSLMESSDDI